MKTEERDIEDREDVLQLLEAFYAKAVSDERIGYFFTRVVPLDLATHIPVIADFWMSALFDGQGYRRNVMAVHKHIHSLSPIHKEDLDRWVQLFSATVAAHFEGPKAELAKQRAASIATLMNIHLHHSQINKL